MVLVDHAAEHPRGQAFSAGLVDAIAMDVAPVVLGEGVRFLGSHAGTVLLDELYARTGAILMGRRTFDVGVEPWGDPPRFHMPVFVITHEMQDPIPKQGGTTYRFVVDGIEAGLDLARPRRAIRTSVPGAARRSPSNT